MKNEILLFENQGVKLEVNMKDDMVCLTQGQMAELFNISRTNIIEHISNIYSDEEFDKNSACQDFRQVRKEGKRTVTRTIPFYNLDMIKGYAVNQKRLEYLEKIIKLIDIDGRIDINLKGNEAQEIIKVINNYSNALNLLDDYDHKRIIKPNGTINENKINYEDCMNIVNKLKFSSDSDLFALERDNGVEAIVFDIYQTFDVKDLYSSIEEKAANFLYLIIKNHVFIDGNKRIAATLFIYFLEFYNLLYKDGKQVIDNNTLVAITLLIAQSNPKEKEILVDLVMNFLSR